MIVLILALAVYGWGGAMAQPLETWGPERPWSVRVPTVSAIVAPLSHPYARPGADE